MAGGNDNRSERPTPRKLQKAREKGQVVRSKEIPSALVLLGTLGVLYYSGQTLIGSLALQVRDLLRLKVPPDMTVGYISDLIRIATGRAAIAVLPVMATALVIGVGANLAQSGLTISWQALGLRFDKLSPKNGISRVLSKNGLVELGKSLALLTIVLVISYNTVIRYLPLYPNLVVMDGKQLLHWTATISYEIFIRVGVFLLVLSIVDYGFQRYRFMEQLKMTKQEVKEEFKESEGDPIIRGRIRRIQREMARKRMMAEVSKADVVITNPTHYAVALSYKLESMEAPQVVAKGVGFLALKIRELAQQHGIAVVENRPLAQTLYKTVEIGEYIPATLYKAVAEILAYIYKARNAFASR